MSNVIALLVGILEITIVGDLLSVVMHDLEVVDLIFFYTRMNYGHFKALNMLPRVSHFCSKIPKKVCHQSMESSVRSMCFRGNVTIKTVPSCVHAQKLGCQNYTLFIYLCVWNYIHPKGFYTLGPS